MSADLAVVDAITRQGSSGHWRIWKEVKENDEIIKAFFVMFKRKWYALSNFTILSSGSIYLSIYH